MQNKNKKILGIDPGFERIGIAILEKGQKDQLLFSECFKTPARLPFEKRLELIGAKIKKIINKYDPDVLAIETLFLNTNQKTVMHVAEARGVIIYECARAKMEIFDASPPQIKTATTGYGKADKKQINKMVKMLLKIDSKKNSDDELDAIAAALTASAYLR